MGLKSKGFIVSCSIALLLTLGACKEVTPIEASSPGGGAIATPSPTGGNRSSLEGEAYLKIESAWETDESEEKTLHGTCAVPKGASLGTVKDCIINIPEAQLFFSHLYFTFGTSDAASCTIVNFAPYYYSVNPYPTSITRSGTKGYITKANHRFLKGESFVISGASPDSWNGTFTVASVSGSSFSFDLPIPPTPTPSPAASPAPSASPSPTPEPTPDYQGTYGSGAAGGLISVKVPWQTSKPSPIICDPAIDFPGTCYDGAATKLIDEWPVRTSHYFATEEGTLELVKKLPSANSSDRSTNRWAANNKPSWLTPKSSWFSPIDYNEYYRVECRDKYYEKLFEVRVIINDIDSTIDHRESWKND